MSDKYTARLDAFRGSRRRLYAHLETVVENSNDLEHLVYWVLMDTSDNMGRTISLAIRKSIQ